MAVDRPSGGNPDRALHTAADHRTPMPDDSAPGGDRPPGRSGWDALDTPGRPPLDALRIDADRAAHILDGDATGGGHRPGTGRPGKTEFPADWDDATITGNIAAVAKGPDSVEQQPNGRWFVRGERDNVRIIVIVNPDGAIWTAWPEEDSPGVVRNPDPKEGAAWTTTR
jgi:Bacterial EndoU nuclease